MGINNTKPGPLLLFGSGETLPVSGKAYDYLAGRFDTPLKIAILETPAGFQPNTQRVAENVGEFLQKRLQNQQPQVQIIPARKRGTDFSPDDNRLLAPMLSADWLFMGPGSPTYAVDQLRDSLAYQYLRGLHLQGSAICLASAAVLAISAWTLPVYEIYKVGQEPFWMQGLDFLGNFGLNVTFLPHWNNQDGGTELDTSRCFMGKGRFALLQAQLDADTCLVGIDEQTALLIDLEEKLECRVFGKGSVTIHHGLEQALFQHGHTFPLELIGQIDLTRASRNIPDSVREAINRARTTIEDTPPEIVITLAEEREQARAAEDWRLADQLRMKIEAQDWQVLDTPQGPQLKPKT